MVQATNVSTERPTSESLRLWKHRSSVQTRTWLVRRRRNVVVISFVRRGRIQCWENQWNARVNTFARGLKLMNLFGCLEPPPPSNLNSYAAMGTSYRLICAAQILPDLWVSVNKVSFHFYPKVELSSFIKQQIEMFSLRQKKEPISDWIIILTVERFAQDHQDFHQKTRILLF